MTDWNSPATIGANALSFSKFVHALLGIFAWEWLISLDFDIAFLTGKRKFRWPMIFYFYGRYAFLGGLIGFVIILDSPTEVNCMAAYRALSVLGNTCLGVASINLSIRTMAVWSHHRYIVWGLVLLSMGHFGIILRSVTNAKSQWVDGAGCVTIDAEPTVFAIMYIYTMSFDLIILVLTGYKLWYMNRGKHTSAVMKLLFKDGLVYFFVAFTVNAIAVVFSLLNLNPVMSLIADLPATTFATIVAGRVVRRLSNYVSNGPELYSDSSRGPISGAKAPSQGVLHAARSKTGVHVEMATFTERDDETRTGGYDQKDQAPRSHLDLESNDPDFMHKARVL